MYWLDTQTMIYLALHGLRVPATFPLGPIQNCRNWSL